MSIEPGYTPVSYVIGGTGPYTIPWPYAAQAVIAHVETDGVLVRLSADTHTLSPAAADTSGGMYLEAAAVAEHAGRRLWISRGTAIEQGWVGQYPREVGLEAQLDALTMAAQDQRAIAAGSIRVQGADLDPVLPLPGHVLIWDGANFVPGPTADDITGAQGAASTATAAAAVLQTMAYGEAHSYTVTVATDTIPLAFDPGEHLLDVNNGLPQRPGTDLDDPFCDYIIVAMESSPSGVGIQFDEVQPVGTQITYKAVRPLQYDPNLNRAEARAARAALVTHIATAGAVVGQNYYDSQCWYRPLPAGHMLYGTDPIADLPGLMPAGDNCLPQHFGVVSDDALAQDDRLGAWIDYMDATGHPGFVPDGLYRFHFLKRRGLTRSLSITCAPRAWFRGLPTRDLVAGDDTVTSHVATFPAGEGTYRVAIITAGVETTWTAGVEYAATGSTIDWAAGATPHGPLATGSSIRIIASDAMIELGAADITDGIRLDWRGGIIDNSERGLIASVGGGTGMNLCDLGNYRVEGAVFSGRTDYVVAQTLGYCDSGLVPTRSSNGTILNNAFVGQGDAGIYAGGGSSLGVSDNGYGLFAAGNLFVRCNTGFTGKRMAFGFAVQGNTFWQCARGATLWHVTGLNGASGMICENYFIGSRERDIDIRRSAIFTVRGNVSQDIGYDLEGVAVTDEVVASIYILGSSNGDISGNVAAYIDLPANPDAWAIRVGHETTGTTLQSNNLNIHDNNAPGFLNGCREGNSGTGNIWRQNNLPDATLPMEVPAARRWHYRKSNLEFEGIGATPFAGAWTPELRLNGTAPAQTDTTALGFYERQGNTVICQMELQTKPTFTPGGGLQLRIYGLPYVAQSIVSVAAAGAISHRQGITLPGTATELVAEVPAGQGYIRLKANAPAATTATLTDAAIATGATVRLDITITYQTAQEAQN